MKDLAILGVVLIIAFIIFVIFWNKKWQGKILDEREANIRLRVRVMISRAVEMTLIGAIVFNFHIRPLSGLEALVIVGLAGVLAEVFSNWYLRKDDCAPLT
ncbi:MAG: hypothetical protein LW878_10565 [Proteobacteria bacterium]|jgi:hypothetical protein|nr:hypothetical protein [Pseudomonadota bacterium]